MAHCGIRSLVRSLSAYLQQRCFITLTNASEAHRAHHAELDIRLKQTRKLNNSLPVSCLDTLLSTVSRRRRIGDSVTQMPNSLRGPPSNLHDAFLPMSVHYRQPVGMLPATCVYDAPVLSPSVTSARFIKIKTDDLAFTSLLPRIFRRCQLRLRRQPC